MSKLSFLALLAAGAFGLGGIALGAAPVATATEASAPTACAQPAFAAMVDPVGSGPMSPRVEVYWDSLSTPAQQHIERGDGEYEEAAINRGHAATSPVVSAPTYGQPGTYHLTATVIDSCDATAAGSIDLTVPMALPRVTPTVACPGTIDQSGYCLMQAGDVTLDVRDPGLGTDWTWNVFPPDSSDATPGRPMAARLETGSVLVVQATASSAAGWLVTTPLRFVAAAVQPPRIETLIAPDRVAADSTVTVGFTVPVGAELAHPSIVIDAEEPIAAALADVRFTSGTHTIAFALTFPDGSIVQRQAIVIASAPFPWLAVLAAGLGAVAAAFLLLLFVLIRRRRQAVAVLAVANSQSRSSIR